MMKEPIVEPFTLELGSEVLPPSHEPAAAPVIYRPGAIRNFREMVQVPVRIERALVATNAPAGALEVETVDSGARARGIPGDAARTFAPGEYVELKVTYPLEPLGACWLRVALLVIYQEHTEGVPEEHTEGVPEEFVLLQPSRLVRERFMLMPIREEGERDTWASTLACHATTQFIAQPKSLFRGHRLIVECDRPEDVDVASFLVQNQWQAAAVGSISAALFTPANAPKVPIDTATPASRITVGLSNRSADPILATVRIEGLRVVE